MSLPFSPTHVPLCSVGRWRSVGDARQPFLRHSDIATKKHRQHGVSGSCYLKLCVGSVWMQHPRESLASQTIISFCNCHLLIVAFRQHPLGGQGSQCPTEKSPLWNPTLQLSMIKSNNVYLKRQFLVFSSRRRMHKGISAPSWPVYPRHKG